MSPALKHRLLEQLTRAQASAPSGTISTIEAGNFYGRAFTAIKVLDGLGGNYGKFDRDGKKMYIDQMEELMDRYKIFMKRFELSDDFMAKMTVEQMNTQLGQFGMTPQQMFDGMTMTLDRMKSELEK